MFIFCKNKNVLINTGLFSLKTSLAVKLLIYDSVYNKPNSYKHGVKFQTQFFLNVVAVQLHVRFIH